jgi:hypothetical protein
MSLTQHEIDTRVNLDDYEPVIDQQDEYNEEWKRYETYGDDLRKVSSTPNNFVWTCIDCDECERCAEERQPDCDCEPLRIVAGFHYVNRQYYIITKKPWVTGDEWD